jgi:carbon-monoxide dehydrogenase small subunit
MLIAAQALLNRNRAPTDEEIRDAIGGNLCRCTGYKQIIDAIKLAASRLQGANAPVGQTNGATHG